MKRFYDEVSVRQVDGGWSVALDGRVVMTQTRKPQIVPTEPLARLLAREWRGQGEEIDPRGFRHRDIADFAIDVVAPDRAGQIDKLLAYAETDTLCYRADPEDALWRRQQDVWEPLVTALEAREGIRMERVSGIVARPLSDEATAALRRRLERLDIFELAGLYALTSLAASLCIGLAALESDADGKQLWDAANLEEDWQTERWGVDAEAADRRAERKAAFLSALEFVRCRQTTDHG
ncbi:ATP12 family chaperone protein [Qipengyuania spongiae]|uniref:Molecular chaperone n=1 Tax=Qipengyuania spongiae TaxID=2909673 RepID=A0ABY5T0W4_9SPHN|nr:ATP12 family protein [Qipengyuania spongiae]UVI40402.1 molecular chaperone [Qipengyuania spongiae]